LSASYIRPRHCSFSGKTKRPLQRFAARGVYRDPLPLLSTTQNRIITNHDNADDVNYADGNKVHRAAPLG
jgi:hypothetical protein